MRRDRLEDLKKHPAAYAEIRLGRFHTQLWNTSLQYARQPKMREAHTPIKKEPTGGGPLRLVHLDYLGALPPG